MKDLRITTTGIRLIIAFERWKPVAYDDGFGFVTVGVGHTKTKYRKGERVSDEQVWVHLVNDLKDVENELERLIEVELTDNEFDALVCFAFNVGLSAFRKSTLLKLLNEGKKDAVVLEFAKWKYVKKKVVDGLVRRRAAEAALFAAKIA